ncbi:MAG TPA: response regulator transcription factor [Puia sp.]|jgi:DNA-binding NarL/FixJ family response regulator|nr:response regulator transcription factor [Puia sp.]
MDNLISVLLAEDHKLLRETLCMMLNACEGIKVIADTGDSKEAILLVERHRPAIVMMDVVIPPVSGIEATTEIKKKFPRSRVIGLSMYSHPGYAKSMLLAGAWGYLSKNAAHTEIIEAIRKVAAGEKFIGGDIQGLIDIKNKKEKSEGAHSLTLREIEIMKLIAQGFSSKEIAAQLKLSVKTVEVHRHNVHKKLDIKRATALVEFIDRHAGDF